MICEDCGANAGGSAEHAGAAADKLIMPAADGSAAIETMTSVRAQTGPHRCRRCGGRLVQRTDDNVDVVRERLKIYHRQHAPLVKYYRGRLSFRTINGARPAERVAADLAAAIEAARNGTVELGGRR
jgi:adenylate kinase family enzyme